MSTFNTSVGVMYTCMYIQHCQELFNIVHVYNHIFMIFQPKYKGTFDMVIHIDKDKSSKKK